MTSDAISLGMMRPVQILVVHEIILTYLHTKLNKLKKIAPILFYMQRNFRNLWLCFAGCVKQSTYYVSFLYVVSFDTIFIISYHRNINMYVQR